MSERDPSDDTTEIVHESVAGEGDGADDPEGRAARRAKRSIRVPADDVPRIQDSATADAPTRPSHDTLVTRFEAGEAPWGDETTQVEAEREPALENTLALLAQADAPSVVVEESVDIEVETEGLGELGVPDREEDSMPAIHIEVRDEEEAQPLFAKAETDVAADFRAPLSSWSANDPTPLSAGTRADFAQGSIAEISVNGDGVRLAAGSSPATDSFGEHRGYGSESSTAPSFSDENEGEERITNTFPRPRVKAWWEEFFDDDYLHSVRRPDPRQVAHQCDFIERSLGLERGATILDVGCGLGLHAVELSARGYMVVGLDLSLAMLAHAAEEAQHRGQKINFLHADMREMSFNGTFDAVICLGTTFGYFDDESNRQLIKRLYRALKPMGLLLLEVANRDYVVRSQPNLVWFEGDGCICMEETQFNYITSRLQVKRTVILEDGRQRENEYSLRLYALHELGQLLHNTGFRVAEASGMEATPGVFFGADSPRLIILAERRVRTRAAPSVPPPSGTGRSSMPPPAPQTTDGKPRI